MSRGSATLVVDLGFGDAGKGTITDHLVRTRGATLVMRANGGAQAGHNVVLDDGTHHTFSQLGAGSFVPGVRTLLASTMVVHPLALAVEARVFAAKTGRDPLPGVLLDAEARVTTPYHQAAGRLREFARGHARHGSCGVGVGETVADALAHEEDVLSVGTLAHDRDASLAKLARVRERLREEFRALAPALRGIEAAALELEVFEDETLSARFVEAARVPLAAASVLDAPRIADIVSRAPAIVGEGAQGVLLDEWHGMHPHTTYSTCTFDAGLDALARYGFDGEVERLGVLRSYMVRHGAGPFPSETPALDGLPEPHNAHGPFQGAFRRGFLDLPLLRYAIGCCRGVDAIALTHADALARLPALRVCTDYELDHAAYGDVFVEDSDRAAPRRLRVSHDRQLAAASRRTEALSAVRPRLEPVELGNEGVEGFARRLEAWLDVRIPIVSSGPTPSEKRAR